MSDKKDIKTTKPVAPPNLANLNIKRATTPAAKEQKKEPEVPTTAGMIVRVVDLALNPSREKMPEMTVIDRLQGRLLPILEIIEVAWNNTIEVAEFRQDSETYLKEHDNNTPVPPNYISDYKYKLAQWQKSIGGKNLQSAIDLTLASIENEAEDKEDALGGGLDEG